MHIFAVFIFYTSDDGLEGTAVSDEFTLIPFFDDTSL